MQFRDRREAGRRLAAHLHAFATRGDLLVLALGEGGVPVAYEVARAIRAPLDVFLVRPLALPGAGEVTFGAIASGGVRILDREALTRHAVDPTVIDRVTRREADELVRDERRFRPGEPADVSGRPVLLVGDGLAPASTMRAAARGLRDLWPAAIAVALPAATREIAAAFELEVDEVVLAEDDEEGASYRDASRASDEELRALWRAANPAPPGRTPPHLS
jgi:predicted phosphoribosyltransferase